MHTGGGIMTNSRKYYLDKKKFEQRSTSVVHKVGEPIKMTFDIDQKTARQMQDEMEYSSLNVKVLTMEDDQDPSSRETNHLCKVGKPVKLSLSLDESATDLESISPATGGDETSSSVKCSVNKDMTTSLEKQSNEDDGGSIDSSENRVTNDIQTECIRYVYRVGETLRFQGSTDIIEQSTSKVEGDDITCSMDCSIQENLFERKLTDDIVTSEDEISQEQLQSMPQYVYSMGQQLTMSVDVDPMIPRETDHVVSPGAELTSSSVKFSVNKDMATSLEKQSNEDDGGSIDSSGNRITSDIQTEASRYVYKVGETLRFQGSTDITEESASSGSFSIALGGVDDSETGTMQQCPEKTGKSE